MTVRALSLHQVTAGDASPAEIVRIAARLGCAHVCLFTQAPRADSPFPVVSDPDIRDLRALMDDVGVSLLNATCFALTPTVDVNGFEAGLARAAALGARSVNVRVLDEDQARVADRFEAFASLARPYGLAPTIEFMGVGVRHTMDQALGVIARTGCGTLALDALHVMRTGVSLEALRRLAPSMVGYIQLCDGPLAPGEAYAHEAAYDRLAPGEGEFPLSDFLAAAPADQPISLEVPQERLRRAGLSAEQRARRAVKGARTLLEQNHA